MADVRELDDRVASTLPPQIAFIQMASAYWVSQCIYVAAKLGIADFLQDTPQHYEQLANTTQTHAPSLYRLLRALASLGIFAEVEFGYFRLGKLGIYLQSNRADSLRAFAMMQGEEHYQAWGQLLYSIRTGESAFEHLYGTSMFNYYAQNPESAQIFDRAMISFSTTENELVVSCYDFSKVQTVVDVAGGYGSLLITILKVNPQLQGILLEVAPVIEKSRSLVDAANLSDRVQLVCSNFFESVPVGGDVYILKRVIHNWDDDRAIAILRNCRQAMQPNGKVLVIEQVIPPGNDPFTGKLLDLKMLVLCSGGRERTESEYRSLFEQTGLKLNRIVSTGAEIAIVEGISAR